MYINWEFVTSLLRVHLYQYQEDFKKYEKIILNINKKKEINPKQIKKNRDNVTKFEQ